MTRRRAHVRRALTVALAAAVLAGCTPLPSLPPFDSPVRLSGEWSRLPDGPLAERYAPLGIALEGRFLVVGGWSGPPCRPDEDCLAPEEPALRDGATFDPETGVWAPIADAPLPVSGSNAAVLDCALYVLTREAWRFDSPLRMLRYEPESDSWTELPAPPGGSTRLLTAGTSLLAIAQSDELHRAKDWIFDPGASTWKPLPDDPLGPSFDREGAWVDGALLLSGKDLGFPGLKQPSYVRVARLDLTTDQWSMLPDSEIIGWSPTPVGELVVFPHTGTADGGDQNNWGRDVPFGGILDPGTGEWSALPDPPGRGGLAGEVLAAGRLTVVGGHLLDPATGAWTLVPAVPGLERTAAAVAAVDDAIVVWGGFTETENLGEGYLLKLPPAG